ncbi:MAG: hypothetical protein HYZ38_09770 [Mycobacterium sp.]|nr:hypothetical protein [Mycobacterium sp.]
MPTADVESRIIESAMPRYDVVLTDHIVVDADPGATLRAARSLDLLTVRSPVTTLSMWVRALPARLTGKAPPVPPRLVLSDGALPGWLVLGESDCEFAFGAVGKFWRPVIEWRDVEAAEFARFDEPGWGKIAANFSVHSYGPATLLSYQCRTATTDGLSHKRFRRYWWLVRPFVGHVMRATLRTIKADAEALP